LRRRRLSMSCLSWPMNEGGRVIVAPWAVAEYGQAGALRLMDIY
jgi:hypothetical protein